MPLSEEEWEKASIDTGIVKDIKSVLDDAYPQALTSMEIRSRWNRAEYPNTQKRVRTILEMLVGLEDLQVVDVESEGERYYRIAKD